MKQQPELDAGIAKPSQILLLLAFWTASARPSLPHSVSTRTHQFSISPSFLRFALLLFKSFAATASLTSPFGVGMLRRKEFHKFLGYAQSADEVFQVLDFRHFPFGENRRPLARLTSARLAHVPFSRHKASPSATRVASTKARRNKRSGRIPAKQISADKRLVVARAVFRKRVQLRRPLRFFREPNLIPPKQVFVKQTRIMSREYKLRIIGIAARTEKTPHNLSNENRVKRGIYLVHEQGGTPL